MCCKSLVEKPCIRLDFPGYPLTNLSIILILFGAKNMDILFYFAFYFNIAAHQCDGQRHGFVTIRTWVFLKIHCIIAAVEMEIVPLSRFYLELCK